MLIWFLFLWSMLKRARGRGRERTKHRVKSVMGQTSELSHPYQRPSHSDPHSDQAKQPRLDTYHHDD